MVNYGLSMADSYGFIMVIIVIPGTIMGWLLLAVMANHGVIRLIYQGFFWIIAMGSCEDNYGDNGICMQGFSLIN